MRLLAETTAIVDSLRVLRDSVLHEKKGDLSGSALGKEVEKAASKIAKKPLHIDKHSVSPKGHDFTFKEGGRFKIRPKPDGAVLAKLQGQPKPHYRYLGVGTDAASAIAALKPEKKAKTKKVLPGIAVKTGKVPAPPAYIPDPDNPNVEIPNPKFKSWFLAQPPEVQAALAKKVMGKAAKKAKLDVSVKKAVVKKGPPAPDHANINGLRLYNDMGVDADVWERYAYAAKHSVDLLKRFGFGFMLKNVTMHLRKSKSMGVLGNYDMKTKTVEIFVNAIGKKASEPSIMSTMVHELGHHYYYREIPRARRKSYRWYFDMAKQPTKGGKKTGDFPSDYGATKRYEDFAEIFAAFYGRAYKLKPKRYKLTPDIMDRFRTFMKQDDRIKVYEDEEWLLRRPLTTANIFEAIPASTSYSKIAFDPSKKLAEARGSQAELWGHKPEGWAKKQERTKKKGQQMCGFRPCKPGEKPGSKKKRGPQPQAWGYQ